MQYYVAIAGQQSGPYTEALVRELLANGTITTDSLAWYEGLPNWAPLKIVLPDIATAATPPALPVQLPPQVPSVQFTSPNLPTFDSTSATKQETQLANRSTRLASYTIDALLLFAAIFVGAIICAIIDSVKAIKTNTEVQHDDVLIAIVLSICLLALAYYQIRLLCKCGQTIGKKLMGIKIVTFADQTQPDFIHVVLLRVGISIIKFIPFIGPILSLVNVCFIFRDDRRCIHDHIAGTIVIKA